VSSGWIDLPQTDSVTIVGPVSVTQGTTPWVVSGTVLCDQGTSPWITNIVPNAEIPFTLLSLTFPALLQELLGSITYDQVTSVSMTGEEILTFLDSGNTVTTVTLTQIAGGWSLNLNIPHADYLLLENGGFIELENGGGAILLEH